jgi:hypothetical protein
MEATSSMNSRHQIELKNRVMADEWNCQKRFFTADAEIVSKN